MITTDLIKHIYICPGASQNFLINNLDCAHFVNTERRF